MNTVQLKYFYFDLDDLTNVIYINTAKKRLFLLGTHNTKTKCDIKGRPQTPGIYYEFNPEAEFINAQFR